MPSHSLEALKSSECKFCEYKATANGSLKRHIQIESRSKSKHGSNLHK